jgi:arylamine N-acetyltransferase
MAGRHTYTNKELEVYFDRISLPAPLRLYDVRGLPSTSQLDFLHVLQKHQIVKIPWENLALHYSWHRTINVAPPRLFHKIMRSQGRGGYGLEVNHLFHTVLLSLGFDVHLAGARVHDPATATYGGFTHVVNLVTVAGIKYLCDAGFGPAGPSRPLALIAGDVQTHVAPAEMRVVCEPVRGGVKAGEKVWVYQHRYVGIPAAAAAAQQHRSDDASHDDDDDDDDDDNDDGVRRDSPMSQWNTCYCVAEVEFLPADVHTLNFALQLNPQSVVTHKVVASRFTTSYERNSTRGPGSPFEREMEGEIDGTITLDGDVLKWRRRGKKVVEERFRCEAERVEALQMFYGVALADEDVDAIKGTAAAVKGVKKGAC